LTTDRHVTEKDKIYGDLIATRKKQETAESEIARLQVSYNRLLKEKEDLENKDLETQDELKKYKDNVSFPSFVHSSIEEPPLTTKYIGS
jgi:chromosome segregation ATPase